MTISDRIRPKLLAAVTLAASAFIACDDADLGATPTYPSAVCCECACTDGTDICRDVIAESDEQVSCDSLCIDACASVEGCTDVAQIDVCEGTPPPRGVDDLRCIDMCTRAVEDCDVQHLIPTDGCRRVCDTEQVPVDFAMSECAATAACEPSEIFACFTAGEALRGDR